ncbi:Cyclic nucleotide-gated olfactory channel [Cladochytrium tenue]|nr:Cyclic nucleotide-gated olfactory channel [Cladochytrium tenue]
MGHIDACLFWFLESLLDSDNSWVYTEALVVDDQSEPVQFQTQYLVSYLTALRSLVLKLRDVTLAAEDVFVIFEFVAGILAYGTVFGNIHSIVEMLDKTAVLNQAEELHQYQMDWLRAYMREKKLRPDLQQMVTAYKEIQWQRSKGMDEELLFSDIPRSVQQEIKNFLYLELVKKVPAFVNTDANFQNLIAFKIKAMVVLDGWYIFRKGDDAEEMFFIKSGKVDICGDQGQIFVTLVTGQFFGEIALFEASKRTATARAKGNVELCSLSKESFNHIMNTYPDVARRIQETIEERKRVEKKKEEERRLREAEAELQKELLATSEKDPAGSSSQPLPPPASK